MNNLKDEREVSFASMNSMGARGAVIDPSPYNDVRRQCDVFQSAWGPISFRSHIMQVDTKLDEIFKHSILNTDSG